MMNNNLKKIKRTVSIFVSALILLSLIPSVVSATPNEDFKYNELSDGTVEIIKYLGADTNIVIPGNINGRAVRIKEMAFEGITANSIVIEEGVISIGDYAFANCTRLETAMFLGDQPEVNYPESIFEDAPYEFFIQIIPDKEWYLNKYGQWYGYNIAYLDNLPFVSTLELSKITWNPATAASSTNITLISNTSWTASSNATNWLTVSPSSGSNNGTITLTAAANTSMSQRTGTITVTAGSLTRTIVVNQAGTDNTSFEGALNITTGTPVSVSVTAANQIRYYKFIPKVSGSHIIESTGGSTGGVDPYCNLYNGSRTQLTDNDDGAGSRNFRITYDLMAGQTYYIGAKCYSTGTGSYTFSITAPTAITVPSTPQTFTAAPGNAQVSLSWTAPSNNGGSAITSYQVSSNNGSTWVTASSSTGHTFTGLTNGTSYTFKVRAVNTAGNGTEATETAAPRPDTLSLDSYKYESKTYTLKSTDTMFLEVGKPITFTVQSNASEVKLYIPKDKKENKTVITFEKIGANTFEGTWSPMEDDKYDPIKGDEKTYDYFRQIKFSTPSGAIQCVNYAILVKDKEYYKNIFNDPSQSLYFESPTKNGFVYSSSGIYNCKALIEGVYNKIIQADVHFGSSMIKNDNDMWHQYPKTITYSGTKYAAHYAKVVSWNSNGEPEMIQHKMGNLEVMECKAYIITNGKRDYNIFRHDENGYYGNGYPVALGGTHNHTNVLNSIGSSGHYKYCPECGRSETENHTLKQISDGVSYYQICSANCGYQTQYFLHQWGGWSVSGSNHERTCTSTGITQSHVIKWSGLSSVGSSGGHYRVCTVCNTRSDISPHSLVNKSLGTVYYQYCSDNCGYETTAFLHQWGEWSVSGSNHERTCTSSKIRQFHYENWNSWSFYSSSEHRRYCSACTCSQYAGHSWKYVGSFKQCTVCYYT